MSVEEVEWDYTRMRGLAAEMVAAVRRAQTARPGVLNAPEATAVFERLVAGERVLVEEIGRAYTVLGIAAKAAAVAHGRRPG
jgi:hypothetical protein